MVEDESAGAGLASADGWGAPFLSFLILGLVVGIPYYALPFFYDYMERAYAWERSAVMLGLPLGTLATLIVGPWLSRVTDLRRAISLGACLCGLAVAGLGWTGGSLWAYYGSWILYMTGWTMAGPLAQQMVLGGWRKGRSGPALALAYCGISFFGAISVASVARPLTAWLGWQGALAGMGAIVSLAGALAWALPRSRKRESSFDGPVAWGAAFWYLLLGSTLFGVAVGGVAQHLKLILAEFGRLEQLRLDALFGWCVMAMLAAGVCGRFVFGWAANRVSKAGLVCGAAALMSVSLALLTSWDVERSALWFSPLFGFGLSADFLTVPLMALERFRSKRVLGVMVPVNTLGQTWYPYAMALLWNASGGYAAPLWMTQGCLVLGAFFVWMAGRR